jgi:hypothetical protein
MTKDKASAEAEHVYALALALEMRPGDLSQPLGGAPTLGPREILKSAGVPLTLLKSNSTRALAHPPFGRGRSPVPRTRIK